ncbi:MAG: amidohydrolase family protein [Pseudolabrys sp.]|jgi:predicted TIM-barrel fold metal-dependent hydrolase
MPETGQPQKARHIPIRANWLSLRGEPILDPERPIIDAHHHLWDKPGSRYLLDEMTDDIGTGHRVVATVFAEGKTNYKTEGDPSLRSLGETEMVAALAGESARLSGGRICIAAGIVGFVDLMLGDAAGAALDRHIEAAGGRFRGVRSTSAWHADPEARGSIVAPPPGLLYDPAHRRGILALTKRDLVFDAWMYHTQLGELADLAHAMPDAAIVLNHQGGPIGIGPYAGRRQEVFADWRYFMRKLARYDNIAVKLGGLGMLMAGFDFQDHSLPPTSDELAQGWGPYVQECIEVFGPERCMFESNFPVDKGTTSYPVLWNAFKKIAAGYSENEKHALFFETANRKYRLGIRSADVPTRGR